MVRVRDRGELSLRGEYMFGVKNAAPIAAGGSGSGAIVNGVENKKSANENGPTEAKSP